MDSLKTKKLNGAVIQLDLSKAHDRVNWLYIRLLLTHYAASPFFHSERGLRESCSFSPLPLLLAAEGLSPFLEVSKQSRDFKGLSIS